MFRSNKIKGKSIICNKRIRIPNDKESKKTCVTKSVCDNWITYTEIQHHTKIYNSFSEKILLQVIVISEIVTVLNNTIRNIFKDKCKSLYFYEYKSQMLLCSKKLNELLSWWKSKISYVFWTWRWAYCYCYIPIFLLLYWNK